MKKQYILGILFFSALWGLSETFLGEYLYNNNARFSSFYLTLIGFAILALSRVYFQKAGTATMIALLTLAYRSLVTRYACHMAAIAMLGISFDIFFSLMPKQHKSIPAFLGCIGGIIAFAFMMTFITNNGHWNTTKMFNHINYGLITAIGCSIVVPLAYWLGENIKSKLQMPFNLNLKAVPCSVAIATFGMWAISIGVFANNMM